MFHHELSETGTVNEHNSLDGLRELDRLRRVPRSRDEDTLVCALPRKGTIERLYLRPSDRLLPPFGLYVTLLEPEFVERDNAINSAVA